MTLREVRALQHAYELMGEAWTLLNRKNEQRHLEGKQRVDVACREGCAACCTFVVDVLDVEAGAIVDHVMTLPKAERDDIIERTQAHNAEWEKFLSVNPFPPCSVGLDGEARWRARWAIRRIPCPLLDLQTHRCRGYEVRPAVCRGYHAAYPPADVPLDLHIAVPPDGCFGTQEDVDVNQRSVWQIRDTLTQEFSMIILGVLNEAKIRWKSGKLADLMLSEGVRRHGWKRRPRRPVDVPTLYSALP